MEEEQKIIFDKKEYNINDLDDQGKYLVSQLNDLSSQSNQIRAKLDQVEMAKRGFEEILRSNLSKPEIVEPEDLETSEGA